MPRACVIVLDAVGAGELPDAASFGDEGSNTLGNVARAVGGLDLPALEERRDIILCGENAVEVGGEAGRNAVVTLAERLVLVPRVDTDELVHLRTTEKCVDLSKEERSGR